MAPKTDAVGKTYPPVSYAVGREKVREFAAAVGEENPLHHDVDAARAAGYADVVAPPMFAVVFGGRAMAPGALRPRGRHRLLPHGPRRPGVRLGTARSSRATRSPPRSRSRTIAERGGLVFYVFESPLDQPGRRDASAPAPGPTSSRSMTDSASAPRAEGHARPVPDRTATRAPRATSTRSTSTRSSRSRSACPAASCTGSGRWRRSRARRPSGGRPARSSGSRCSSAAWACPSRRSP